MANTRQGNRETERRPTLALHLPSSRRANRCKPPICLHKVHGSSVQLCVSICCQSALSSGKTNIQCSVMGSMKESTT